MGDQDKTASEVEIDWRKLTSDTLSGITNFLVLSMRDFGLVVSPVNSKLPYPINS